MRGPGLIASITYAAYWARARRIELVSLAVGAVVSAALWGQDLPTELLRPDLAPEQMVQLLSALYAMCVILAVRRDRGPLGELASVRLTGRRLLWLGTVFVLAAICALGAAQAMPEGIAGCYVRNVSVYVGAGLLLGSVSTALGLSIPWLWFAVSVTLGRSSDQGAALTEWWAYPLQDPGWHPAVAVVLVCLGSLGWLARK